MTNNPPINTSLATDASKILLRRLQNSSNENTVDFNVEVDDYIVGSMQLTSIVPHQTAQLNIYSRDEIYWENGVVEVAVYQLLVCAKEVLKLQSVYVEYIKENNAAVQLYQKNGFVPHNSSSDFFTSVCLLEKVPPPMVSVFCLVYNHEKFIGEAIEGFLMQKTNFTNVLVIGEDCSKDGSRAVILEYAHKFPGKFKLILHEKNTGGPRNQQLVFENCTGKYLAMCEGDDYWTDPFKLQKQVDFVESNPDYGLVHADVNLFQVNKTMTLNGNSGFSNRREPNSKEELFNRLIAGDYVIRTATVLFRTHLLKLMENDTTFLMGDTPMWLNFSQVTKFKYIDEVFAVYRIMVESGSKSPNKKKLARFRLSILEMQLYYIQKFNYPISSALKKKYNSVLFNYKLRFDTSYKPIYQLFSPRFFERLRFRLVNGIIFRTFFLVIDDVYISARTIYRKVRYTNP